LTATGLGLILALVCALCTNLSALFKAPGAVLARPSEVRHPLRSAHDLFRQKWFAIGWILALCAWGLHIEALALAPLSTVQAIPLGGLVLLAVLAALISFVISFYASARSLQIGQAVEVVAITSVAANLSAIVGGILAFAEPIGSGAIGIIGRVLAFGFVTARAALVPAPLRAHGR
jgi:hypothetical protein